MELLGSALLAILLFAVFIMPVGAFASSLVRCVSGCSGEKENRLNMSQNEANHSFRSGPF